MKEEIHLKDPYENTNPDEKVRSKEDTQSHCTVQPLGIGSDGLGYEYHRARSVPLPGLFS